jgi:hypothetical protein
MNSSYESFKFIERSKVERKQRHLGADYSSQV